ncbi:MAG: nitrous oxide-stimulated promoter family protein [Candidatus Omnitrophota bacterium]|nr:nitrous oxide-stimulated promoter family protein [Candidatus Omnitrophota bacterium]
MVRQKKSFSKMDREKRTIEAMIGIYCSGRHKSGENLCQECAGLLGYARLRLDRCPFGEDKPACSKCAIHCYNPSMRAKVTAVMKYAGPRMISKHPILTLIHGLQKLNGI